MSRTQSKHSVAKVTRETTLKDGRKVVKLVGYLSRRDEEQGIDIQMDMLGYTVTAL